MLRRAAFFAFAPFAFLAALALTGWDPLAARAPAEALVTSQAAVAETEGGAAPRPPVAPRRSRALTAHGHTRIDPYYWLRDDSRQDPEVLAYLAAENAYTEAMLGPTRELQEELFREIVGRIQEDDSTVPVREGSYWYTTRYEEGREYPILARKRGSPEAPEEVFLDANGRAAGHAFYDLGNWEVSSGEDILAFAEDTLGRRQYTIRFKDLRTGELYPEEIPNAAPALAWANDNRTLFYVERHPVTLLEYRVRKHVLGTDPAADPIVYEEEDKAFYTWVYKSRSDRFVIIHLESTLSSEVRYLPADDPGGTWRVFLPREEDHLYQIEDLGDRFLVRTNQGAENFRIAEVAAAESAETSAWRDVVPHREDAFVHGFQAFRGFLAVAERSGGLRKIRIKPWGGGEERLLAFDEPAYTAYLGDNPEPDTARLRYLYTSLTTPRSTFEIDLETGERTLLKREPVVGDFDPGDYVTEYLTAPARDGAEIPVSLVYRRGLAKDGTAPLLQLGYGSYGSSYDPTFSSPRLSLLERGFVVAIAHIRGGQERGRAWYERGKLREKKNTFTDFVDVTEFLVAAGYAHPGKVFAFGRSAGGLLMGAVANLRPDLYRGILTEVPFVDVVTTMLDESIPLTTNEYDEWGDPRVKEYYDYILSYSPYDQVAEQAYPAMLVTTGLWDSQVQYWEPAKWVAKLRAMKTDPNPLLLHVEMEAGHGGKSGRFRRHRETALEYAFILDLLGRPGSRRPDPEEPQGGDLEVPEGWKVRLDHPSPEIRIGSDPGSADIYFVNMTPGWHITTGPAAIFYHPASTATGDYRIEATFHLFDPGERNEAFGLLFGGRDLGGAGQSYEYFLIRNSGEFLLKRRRGETTEVLRDWTESAAVVPYRQGATSVRNDLAVEVAGEKVDFFINARKVASLPRSELQTDGVVGLRVNHRLNLHVSDLAIR